MGRARPVMFHAELTLRSIRGFALHVFHMRSSLRAAALSCLLSLILFAVAQPARA
jgi:hypothetical protein